MQQNSKISRMNVERRAATLLMRGFKYSIVSNQIGSQPALVRTLWKALRPPDLIKQSYTMTSTRAFIETHEQAMLTSELLVFYIRVGGRGVYRSLDIDALMQAYDLFCAHYDRMVGSEGRARDIMSINIAWLFARDLRSKIVTMKKCAECGTHHVRIHDHKIASACPFCAMTEAL